MEKFKFVKHTILWKFCGKLCTLDAQKVQIQEKIEFVEYTKSPKFNGKLSTLDEKNLNSLNVQYCENLMEIHVQWMYKQSGFMEKFEFAENTISRKFNAKLCTLDVQKVQSWEKFEFVECMI